jgi:hypothetical protein
VTNIEIRVNGASAVKEKQEGLLTAGMVGATATFAFDSAWAGLTKTAVFRCGGLVRDVIGVEDSARIPTEVLCADADLYVGVEGRSSDGAVVIPTVWVRAAYVYPGANASGDPSVDPELPVWAQIQAMIGDLAKLETVDKSCLVAAVNEALRSGGGTVSQETIARLVEEYLAENPPVVTEMDPTVPDWAKQPEKPVYTADEVGALRQGELQTGIDSALEQAKTSGVFNGKDGKDGEDGKDGRDGEDGKDGADGKSAYQYAQDAGYGGTEEEFAQKLAEDAPSGGGSGGWKKLIDYTTEVDISSDTVSTIDFDTDLDGNPLNAKHLYLKFSGTLQEKYGVRVRFNSSNETSGYVEWSTGSPGAYWISQMFLAFENGAVNAILPASDKTICKTLTLSGSETGVTMISIGWAGSCSLDAGARFEVWEVCE